MSITCFIIIPFREFFEELHEHTLKPALEEVGIKAVITKEMAGIKWPFKKIHEGIEASLFCIADITGLNPNVMYEVGYATAAGKKVILIWDQSQMKEPPFDVNYFMGLPYNSDSDKLWSSKLAKDIKRHAKEETKSAAQSKAEKQKMTEAVVQKDAMVDELSLAIITALAVAETSNMQLSVLGLPRYIAQLGHDILDIAVKLKKLSKHHYLDRDYNANGDEYCGYNLRQTGYDYLAENSEQSKMVRATLPPNMSNFTVKEFSWGRY